MFIKAPSSQRERARDGNARKLLSRFCCSPAEACRRSGEDEVLKMRKIYMVIFARETLAHCVVRQKASIAQRDCVSSCFAASVWSTRGGRRRRRRLPSMAVRRAHRWHAPCGSPRRGTRKLRACAVPASSPRGGRRWRRTLPSVEGHRAHRRL